MGDNSRNRLWKMVSLIGVAFQEDSWYFLLGLDGRFALRPHVSTRWPSRCPSLDFWNCDHLPAILGLLITESHTRWSSRMMRIDATVLWPFARYIRVTKGGADYSFWKNALKIFVCYWISNDLFCFHEIVRQYHSPFSFEKKCCPTLGQMAHRKLFHLVESKNRFVQWRSLWSLWAICFDQNTET